MRARRSVFSPPLYRQLSSKTPEQGFALRALFRVGIKLSPYGIGQRFFAVSMVNADRNLSGKPARSDWFTEIRLHPGEHMSSPERAVPRIPQSPTGNRSAWPQAQDIENRKPPQRSLQRDGDGSTTGRQDPEAAQFQHNRQLDSLGNASENGGGRSATIPETEQFRESGRIAATSAFQDPANPARSASNSPTDSTSKVFNFPLRERLMNAREVADRLGVSERWVRDHTTRRSPKIRAVKLGTLIRYRPADVDTFMDHLDTLRPSSHTRFGV